MTLRDELVIGWAAFLVLLVFVLAAIRARRARALKTVRSQIDRDHLRALDRLTAPPPELTDEQKDRQRRYSR